jgi:hypothetical protein
MHLFLTDETKVNFSKILNERIDLRNSNHNFLSENGKEADDNSLI